MGEMDNRSVLGDTGDLSAVNGVRNAKGERDANVGRDLRSVRDGRLAGFEIPRIGMGTMALAIEGRPDRETAIETIHAALDEGVRYLDTAWSYYLPSRPGTGEPEDLGYV